MKKSVELAALGVVVVARLARSLTTYCYRPGGVWGWWWVIAASAPCGRSVPDAIIKAVAWVEKVAEFQEEQRATHGRFVWAAKDKIVDVLSKGAPLIKRAPRYPVLVLVQLEAVVVDPGHAIGWRVWAWAKLVKIWESLRWSHLQAIISAELSFLEGRLATVLRRTKTSGPNRRVKELPLYL